MTEGTVRFHYSTYQRDWDEIEAEVIEESLLTIFVNGKELATLMCTPRDPEELALGFLANEELISTLDEVEISYVCGGKGCVDLWLSHTIDDQPRRKIITSGCSGGQTFSDIAASRPPLQSDARITPEVIAGLLSRLQDSASLYARARGVHTSALSDGDRLVTVAEDIGRHNTLDRLRGGCLRRGVNTAGLILLTTGRISSEMIDKAAKMGCPVVASRTSPTSLSVELARSWNITLCGYVRRNRMNIYAHPERLQTESVQGGSSAEIPLSISTDIDSVRIRGDWRG